MNVCIAGKNNIAISALNYLLNHYPENKYYACCNQNDNGFNGFQRSFRHFCETMNVQIVDLKYLETINDLLFISLEFDRIIKPERFIDARLYNIHFSLLPSYKGMFTSALPILYNEKFSGVTFHEIDNGIDTGKIIDQIKFDLPSSFTSEDLYLAYIDHSIRLFESNVDNVLSNNLKPIQQPIENSSYYSKSAIDYSNLKIDFNKTCNEIFNQIRAFSFPFYQLPKFGEQTVFFSNPTSVKSTYKPGRVIEEDEFAIELTTIDYNIRLLKDRREELFKACENGDIDKIKYFVHNQYPIKQRSSKGWDCLIIAAYNNQFDLVKYLIEELSWDVNTINNNGTTFLMYLMTACSRINEIAPLSYALALPDIDILQKDFFSLDIFYYAEKYKCEKVINTINNFKPND